MRIKKRFSLAALFVIVTVAVLLLAFGQIRRQSIMRSVSEMNDAGVKVIVKDRWWTTVWLPTPRNAILEAHQTAPGQFMIGPSTYSTADANEHITQLRERLKSLGVKQFVVDASALNGSRRQLLFDLAADEETNREYQLMD